MGWSTPPRFLNICITVRWAVSLTPRQGKGLFL